MNSSLYEGAVRHRRFTPVAHEFRYRLFLVYLDLGELDQVFAKRWFWSTGRFNLAWFRRDDYVGDSGVSLDASIRELVNIRTGVTPTGPIRLLTNLRYFGYAMNPVSFYFCFDKVGEQVETMVAEVTNTPWGERHCYVFPVQPNDDSQREKTIRFDNAKEFHVSPFMEMAMHYYWQVSKPGEQLLVQIDSHDKKQRVFDSTLTLSRREISGFQLARVLVRYPMMTARVAAGIYWQAFRLWRKKAPFFSHPASTSDHLMTT